MLPAAHVWSLGVLTFLLLFAYSPFSVTKDGGSLDTGATRNLVLGGFLGKPPPASDELDGPWFPQHFPTSKMAQDLIKRCLKLKPESRISVEEAVLHPFLGL